MILHTNFRTHVRAIPAHMTDIIFNARKAAILAGKISTDVHIADGYEVRGSRTHVGAVSFSLEFMGEKVVGDGRRYRNSGNYGASRELSATWDEHGHIMAQIFEIDPTARFGSAAQPIYDGRDDFHKQTGNAYRVRPFVSLEKTPRTQYVQAWECVGAVFSGTVYTEAIALDKMAKGCSVTAVTIVRYPDGTREYIKGGIAQMVQAERER